MTTGGEVPGGNEPQDPALIGRVKDAVYPAVAGLFEDRKVQKILSADSSPLALPVASLFEAHSSDTGYVLTVDEYPSLNSVHERWTTADGKKAHRRYDVYKDGWIVLEYGLYNDDDDRTGEQRVHLRQTQSALTIEAWNRLPEEPEGSGLRDADYMDIRSSSGQGGETDEDPRFIEKIRDPEVTRCVDPMRFYEGSEWEGMSVEQRRQRAARWAHEYFGILTDSDALAKSYVMRKNLYGDRRELQDATLTEHIGHYMSTVLSFANEMNAWFGFTQTDPAAEDYKPYRKWPKGWKPKKIPMFDVVRQYRYRVLYAIEHAADLTSRETYENSIRQLLETEYHRFLAGLGLENVDGQIIDDRLAVPHRIGLGRYMRLHPNVDEDRARRIIDANS